MRVIVVALVSLFAQVSPSPPRTSSRTISNENEAFVIDIRENLKRANSPQRVGRQDDDDDEGDRAAQLTTGILKVVGSALTGNISSLIDTSVALFPPEIQIEDRIANAIGVLVENIKAASPGQEGPNSKGTNSSVTTSTRIAPTVTTPPTTRTTDSEEEDSEEKELRTNASTNSNSTVVPGSTPITLLNSKDTQQLTPDAMLTTVDPDNKASWITLLGNGTDSLQNINLQTGERETGSTALPVGVKSESKVAGANNNEDRGKYKVPTSLNDTENDTRPEDSFGVKLNYLLLKNKPNLTDFSIVLQNYDRINNITDNVEEVVTLDLQTNITATTPASGTIGIDAKTESVANYSSTTEGRTTIFPPRTTTESSTTDDDDDEDEDEDENSAV